MKYRRICGLIFALLISVSVFGIDFGQIRNQYMNDSTGLDTAEYVAVLGRMLRSEMDSYDVHRVLYAQDSSASELFKMAECNANAKLIVIEKANLYGAEIDSTDVADMDESDISALWLLLVAPPVAAYGWYKRWKAKRKAKVG